MIMLKEIPSGWQVKPSPTNDGIIPLPEQDEDIQARTTHIRDLLLGQAERAQINGISLRRRDGRSGTDNDITYRRTDG